MKIIEGFKLRKIANEYYVLGEGIKQMGFNRVLLLNDAAAYIWQEIDGKDFDAETIAQLLSCKYGFEHDEALGYAQQTIDYWLSVPLIEV